MHTHTRALYNISNVGQNFVILVLSPDHIVYQRKPPSMKFLAVYNSISVCLGPSIIVRCLWILFTFVKQFETPCKWWSWDRTLHVMLIYKQARTLLLKIPAWISSNAGNVTWWQHLLGMSLGKLFQLHSSVWLEHTTQWFVLILTALRLSLC